MSLPPSRQEQLGARIRRHRRVIVAFSGGVDSAVVLRAAIDALGRGNVLAATSRSPSVPQGDLRSAEQVARRIGANHEWIDPGEFEDANYLKNPVNRCYFCKSALYDQLAALASERNFDAVLNGVIADDLGDYRPGIDAGRERRVESPLAECGLTKADVRALARELQLGVEDKPASPCLSSRIPYGQPVTVEKLRQIDAAESLLHELGFAECRVRHHGSIARIEVPATELARLCEPAVRDEVDQRLRALGFAHVTIDLRGFRSGSLNEAALGPGMLPARS